MKFVDMFCGIGTIRMGFEKANWECVYSIEWDKFKRGIYNVIFGNEPEGSDIRSIRADDIPKADCWTFGAPCQDFSISGKRKGLEGDRSSLVREVFRLVRETKEEYRPKYLLYENVKGMFSSNKGLDYFEILFEMESLGYDIEWQLLNSKDFGVPQNRQRVFTIGHLRGRGGRKIFPIGGINSKTIDKIVSTGHQATDVYSIEGVSSTLIANGGGQGGKTGLYLIGNLDRPQTNDFSNRVYSSEGIGRTLMGSGGGSSDKTGLYMNKGRIRRLTPREAWRLQGISDKITDKVMAAGISDSQMYRGAGDACTVNVIYEIAKRFR